MQENFSKTFLEDQVSVRTVHELMEKFIWEQYKKNVISNDIKILGRINYDLISILPSREKFIRVHPKTNLQLGGILLYW